MSVRARRLNAMMLGRAHKANPNSLFGSVYRLATDGPGRRTKKSMVIQTWRNPSVRNDASGDYNYQNKGLRRYYSTTLMCKHSCLRITSCDKGTDGFLKNIPTVQMQRGIIRKLVLWRTGVLPGSRSRVKIAKAPRKPQRSYCGMLRPEERQGPSYSQHRRESTIYWMQPLKRENLEDPRSLDESQRGTPDCME